MSQEIENVYAIADRLANGKSENKLLDEVTDGHVTPIIRSTPVTKPLKKELEVNPNTGAVVSNARNAEKVLASSIFADTIAYDEFRNTEVIKKDLPWRKKYYPSKPYENWTSADDKRLRHYMNKYFSIKGKEIILDAFIEVSRMNAFHPVKEYLEAQLWDHTPRVDTVFIDYLGAEDSPYTRAVTRKWLVAAVARIYEPGCKFDYMPVLVGAQGIGKSSLIAKLGKDWFSDSLRNLENKEAGEHLQSSWIFEFGELAAMKKNEVEEIKAFVSKQSDSYRLAYDRVVSEFPRRCVFIGTTNRSDFLRDQTGNRRFWAITIDGDKRKHTISDLTDEVVGQIWAEAMYLFRQQEETLYLNDELETVARVIQENHMEEDPRTGMIESYLELLLPPEWERMKLYERVNFVQLNGEHASYKGERRRQRVCAAEIWAECLGHDHRSIKSHEASAICAIVRNIDGWEDRKPSRTTFPIYGKQTTFIRTAEGQRGQ